MIKLVIFHSLSEQTTQLRAEVRVQENASVHRPILFTIMHQRFSAEMWLPFEFGRTSVLRIVNPYEPK